ncbi:major facilitator superfamily domain-containing protein [Aspergillus ambiguus]|uniref:MFS transporter n=1 Tax=Aspergillus ambiguus TaxID=176160 RepID=UPI003CCE1577
MSEETLTSKENIRASAVSHRGDGIVGFDGPDDPLHPFNWPMRKRVKHSLISVLMTMLVSFASSIYAPTVPFHMKEYGISREVSTLGVSLYVFGFAFGPLIFGPFSELKGRHMPLVLCMLGFTVFSFATAVSKDLSSLLILRFFTGFFGSGPLTVCVAGLTDIFSPSERGVPIALFCLTVFTGPLIAPFIGGFIMMNKYLGWRWTSYLPGILGGPILFVVAFFLEETYHPILLARKADRLRRETGDWSIHALHDQAHFDLRAVLTGYLAIPLKMLVCDPITLCMCVFGAFVYGLLYLFLTTYPRIFEDVYRMNAGVGNLPYIGVVIGQILGAVALGAMQPWVARKMAQNDGAMLPEWRLPMAVPGAVAFSAGLFWLGWTGYTTKFHWMVPTASGLLTGFGLLTMFLPSLTYLVEARPTRSASAVAAHTFLRSAAAGSFPIFSWFMFDGLGIEWACTLLGCVAAVMIPIPVVLYVYGARIRGKGQLSVV